MTAHSNAAEIDVDGIVDESTGIRYLGKATKGFDGIWLCLADVHGALCRVEVRVSPTICIDGDPGDEDDGCLRALQHAPGSRPAVVEARAASTTRT